MEVICLCNNITSHRKLEKEVEVEDVVKDKVKVEVEKKKEVEVKKVGENVNLPLE